MCSNVANTHGAHWPPWLVRVVGTIIAARGLLCGRRLSPTYLLVDPGAVGGDVCVVAAVGRALA
jgi:hypothetical protein